ncbi:MAG: arginine--tRNA ligase [Candidatus Gracilibacteria bacterium]|nr:arginine--tRNA ligase [Candidatus Gracilibacteria bacterium]
MEKEIIKLLKQKINENYSIELDEIKLENPPKKDLGDFAFGCFVLSKDLKKSPAQISQELAGIIKNEDIIEEASAAGPYLNIKVSKSIFTNSFYMLYNYLYNDKNYFTGNIDLYKGKTVVIDYIGANVGKPLHIGHMCTPNQGQAIINVYRKLGYKVIADSHIGDWGIIFGKLIKAYKLWGNEEKLHENAIEHLLELYVKATDEAEKHSHLDEDYRNEFKLLSEGNLESVGLWREFTKYSIDAAQVQLDRLHIKPDYNIGESFYEGLGLPKMEDYPDLKYDMHSIVEELIKKGIATQNEDGSVGVVFDEEEKIPSCVLQKRDGTHGYLASDLAAIKYRMENWAPEKIVYFVDVRQQLHLKQAFTIAKKVGWLGNTELMHAYNGFISLKDGAMSTRKGRIIKLDKLLDEAEERAKKILLEKRDDITGSELEELSKIIGIGAIKYGYLKKSRETDVVFDWDEFMSFEGNSGPYIQYAYVRAVRILENYGKSLSEENIGSLELSEEVELVKAIGSYFFILEKTKDTAMPHHLCAYAYDLTKTFNAFYNNVPVLNETDESKKMIRLKLVKLFSLVIKDCFNLLGIDMPEKM